VSAERTQGSEDLATAETRGEKPGTDKVLKEILEEVGI
jgi:hypothetical protein